MRIRSLFTAALSVAFLIGGALPAVAVSSLGAPHVSADPARAQPAHTEASEESGTKADTESGTEPGSDAPAEVAPPSIVLAAGHPVVTDLKSPIEFDALVRNPAATALAGGELVIELSDAPIQKATELADPAGLAFTPLSFVEMGETPAASDDKPGELRATIEVTPGELPLTDATPTGTYLVRASLVTEGSDVPQVTTTVPLVWRGPGDKTDKKAALSIIVPFVLPANIPTLPTRNQLSNLTPGWDDLLTAAESARATLAIDPRVIGAIRGYGEEAPEAARDFLLRLEASTSPSFLLQFADADVAAQAALGFTSLLEPTNLEFLTRFGTFVAPEPVTDAPGVTDTAGAAEDATPPGEAGAATDTAASGALVPADASGADAGSGLDAGSDASAQPDAVTSPETDSNAAPGSDENSDQSSGLAPEDEQDPSSPETDAPDADTPDAKVAPPTLTELLAWPGAATAWPAAGDVDDNTLTFLSDVNIDSVVLDSGNVKHTGGPRAPLKDGDVVVTDAPLGAAAKAALSGETDIDRAAALAQLVAELAVHAQSGGAGVVLGLDRAATAAADDPASLVAALTELDFVRPTRVPDQQEGTAELRAAGPLEPRLALLRAASDREASVNEVGAVLVDPQYLSGYQRTRLLDLFATRYAPADGGFDAASTKFRTRDSELLTGVQVISTEHTQLVGVTTNVPVQLHNSLPFDASVTVKSVPVSAAIDVKQRVFTDVFVEAEGNETVLVPVKSRISSGVSGLVVTVSAPGGGPTVFTGTLDLSISTKVETVAMWVIGVGAGVLLVFGVVRSVRKRRKRVLGAQDLDDPGPTPSISSSVE